MADESSTPSTPPRVAAAAKLAVQQQLPTKSAAFYEASHASYQRFLNYCQRENIKKYSENALLGYFIELKDLHKRKSSSLWSHYSMIRSLLHIREKIDISKFLDLQAFLKKYQREKYHVKNSAVLTKDQFVRFLTEAPDHKYLGVKSCARSINLKKYEIFANIDSQKGDGFLSEIFTGNIIDKENEDKIEIAIKLKIDSDRLQDSEPVFENEVYFYSVIFPELNKFQTKQNVKEPFNNIRKYIAGSAQSGFLCVAMENLVSKGYTLLDKNKYLDHMHLEVIFKTYGKFHALSFNFKEKNPENFQNLVKDIKDPFTNVPKSENIPELMRKSYLAAITFFDPISEAIISKLEKLIRDEMGFRQGYKGNFSCLRHGDCWSNNIMFKYSDTGELIDIKLLDLQLVTPGTPIHDSSYFFYSGASKEDFDRLDYYLELYYRSFSEFARELGGVPEELFSFAVLQNEWKVYGCFGIVLACHLWLVKLMDKTEIVEVLEMKDLSTEQYWDMWIKRIKRIRQGPEYRKRARDICLHAVEYGLA